MLRKSSYRRRATAGADTELVRLWVGQAALPGAKLSAGDASSLEASLLPLTHRGVVPTVTSRC
jgi:hypothetical protein